MTTRPPIIFFPTPIPPRPSSSFNPFPAPFPTLSEPSGDTSTSSTSTSASTSTTSTQKTTSTTTPPPTTTTTSRSIVTTPPQTMSMGQMRVIASSSIPPLPRPTPPTSNPPGTMTPKTQQVFLASLSAPAKQGLLIGSIVFFALAAVAAFAYSWRRGRGRWGFGGSRKVGGATKKGGVSPSRRGGDEEGGYAASQPVSQMYANMNTYPTPPAYNPTPSFGNEGPTLTRENSRSFEGSLNRSVPSEPGSLQRAMNLAATNPYNPAYNPTGTMNSSLGRRAEMAQRYPYLYGQTLLQQQQQPDRPTLPRATSTALPPLGSDTGSVNGAPLNEFARSVEMFRLEETNQSQMYLAQGEGEAYTEAFDVMDIAGYGDGDSGARRSAGEATLTRNATRSSEGSGTLQRRRDINDNADINTTPVPPPRAYLPPGALTTTTKRGSTSTTSTSPSLPRFSPSGLTPLHTPAFPSLPRPAQFTPTYPTPPVPSPPAGTGGPSTPPSPNTIPLHHSGDVTTRASFSYAIAHPWVPQRGDELRLEMWDRVCVVQVFDDGWCEGVRVRSDPSEAGTVGMFPLACLQDPRHGTATDASESLDDAYPPSDNPQPAWEWTLDRQKPAHQQQSPSRESIFSNPRISALLRDFAAPASSAGLYHAPSRQSSIARKGAGGERRKEEGEEWRYTYDFS